MIDILHTTISPCDNERRIFNEAESAAKRGWQVEIFALALSGIPLSEKRNNYQIQRIRIPAPTGGPMKFILFNLSLLAEDTAIFD